MLMSKFKAIEIVEYMDRCPLFKGVLEGPKGSLCHYFIIHVIATLVVK